MLGMSATRFMGVRNAITRLFSTGWGILGSLFAFCGAISAIGALLDPLPERVVLSVVLLVPAVILLSVHAIALHKDRVLLRKGQKVSGQAQGILDGVLFHSGPVVYTRHFSVRFHYTVDGVRYTGRSRFYWMAPILPPDGHLTVFVDPANPQRCAVDL